MSATGNLTHRATHATWWSSVEISARYGAQFAVTVVLARLLNPADFGLMAMLLVFTTLAASLVEGGLGSALVQKRSTTPDDETSVFIANFGMGLVLALALWWLAPSIAAFYQQPAITPLLRTLVWLLPLGSMATVPNALLSQRLDFRKRAGAELAASIGAASVALVLAWRGFGVRSLVWQALTGAMIRAGMLWWLSGWLPRGRYDSASFARLFRFGGLLLLANTMNVASVRLQSLLIGKLFDPRVLGFYSMAQDTQQAPTQFMSALLNRVGLPMFASVADQPTKLTGALRLALRLSMFLFVPCMAGIVAIAPQLIELLYGPQWAPITPILRVLALAAMFWPIHVLNLAALTALGRSGLVLKLELAKAAVTIPLVALAASSGALPVAWAVLAAGLGSVLINTRYSHRLLGCGLRTQLLDLLPGFALAGLAAAAAWLVAGWSGPAWLDLMLAAAVALATYISGAGLLRLRALSDLVDFTHALRRGPQDPVAPRA